MELDQLFTCFEGLGNNCEFGIVQTSASARRNAGLFRNVGFLRTEQMIDGMRAGFAGMFDNGQYSFVKPDGWPDYALDCHRYGFRFHTGVSVQDPELAKVEKQIAAFRYMKFLLLDDLRLGEKIFVYRHADEFDETLSRRLLQAIRGHGPGRLVHVRQDASLPFGSVQRVEDGLFLASIGHLSNENPPIVDFAAWEKITRTVLRMLDPRSASRAIPNPERAASQAGAGSDVNADIGDADDADDAGGEANNDNDDDDSDVVLVGRSGPAVPALPSGREPPAIAEHRVFSGGYFFHVSMPAEPEQEYTGRVWLLIPNRFSGDAISLEMIGYASERFIAADMTVRNEWQSVSVTARVPAGQTRLVLAIRTTPDATGFLYTSDWSVQPELAEVTSSAPVAANAAA